MSGLPPKADIHWCILDLSFGPIADIVPLRSIIDRRAAQRKVERTAQALGHGFVLDCTNDRREYGPASATRDQLGDHAANAQIARLCRRHDRRQG
jgi:hypothetical protein